MAAYFWINGTGNTSDVNHWSLSSGGAHTTTTPGIGDTANFDSNAGTGTVTVDAAMTVVSVTIDKAGLTVLCNAGLNTNTGAVTLKTGTLNTNGQACSWNSFQGAPTGAGTRALTLGASVITLTSTTQPWQIATTTGLTFSSGTSQLVFAGNGPSLISMGSLTYNSFKINNVGSGTVTIGGGTNTFNGDFEVFGSSSGRTGALQTQKIIVKGTYRVRGNSAINRILVQSAAAGNPRIHDVAAKDIANVTYQDITAAGAAAPFTGDGLGDAAGNAGISFDTPMNLYRVGAAGAWSDVSYWFTDDVTVNDDGTTTPRTPRIPLAQDTVVVDSRATGTIDVDMPRLGAGLDLSGFAGTFAASVPLTVYGSVTLSNDPAFSITGAGNFALGGRHTQVLISSGKTIPQAIRIDAPGGIYSLQDDLTVGAGLTLTNGTLDANDHNVTMASFSSTPGNNFRTLLMKSGTWTLTGTGVVWNVTANTALTITRGTSTILVADTSGTDKTFTGNGRTYRNLTFAGGTGALNLGGSTFGTVTFPPGATVVLTSDTTTTVSDLAAVGTAGNPITIRSSIAGTSATIRKNGGTVVADYLSLTDNVAAGTAQFYAGVHSVDGGGNAGWQFSDPVAGTAHFMAFFAGRL